MLKFSAVLACATGIVLAVAVTAFHLGRAASNTFDWWFLVIFSYFPAAVIFAGGTATLRGAPRGPILLMVAWGFMAGVGCMAVIFGLLKGDLGWAGMIMAISVLGLVYARAGEMLGGK